MGRCLSSLSLCFFAVILQLTGTFSAAASCFLPIATTDCRQVRPLSGRVNHELNSAFKSRKQKSPPGGEDFSGRQALAYCSSR